MRMNFWRCSDGAHIPAQPPEHKGLPGIKLNLKDVLCPFAQGGGGSFKDRKTIGGVSCGEAWMAERTH